MNWEVWGIPLAILAVGLAAGAAVAALTRDGPAPRSGSLDELRAHHEALMARLRELEADRGKLDPAEYTRRRERLVDQAASALRALEAASTPAGSPETSSMASKTPKDSDRSQVALWAGVAVAFFALLGVLLSQNAAPRQEGQVMTGGTSAGAGGEQAAPAGNEQEMMAKLTEERKVRQAVAQEALLADPADLEALNVLTYDALLYRELEAAMQHMEAARTKAPENADVLIHLAILQISVGMQERAQEALDQAARANPDSPKLRLWRGFLYARQGKAAEAEADLLLAAERANWPEERMLALGLLQELRAPPPAAGGMAPPAAPTEAGGEARFQGRVEAAEGVAVPPEAVLFVYVRRAAEAAGPPVAALKLPAGQVPLDFRITDANLLPMAGGVWPEQVWLQARVDLDGNAATREEGAPTSEVIGPIASGTGDLSLILR